VAYRAPTGTYWFGHLLYGCRGLDQNPTTTVLVVGDLTALWAFALRVRGNDPAGPENVSWADIEPSLCDRWTLWAEDDPVAPQMTRQQKLSQVCPE
jgi:hypothetical protein